MALNLWKVSGQPASFSVGTTQQNYPVPHIRNNTNYRIKLKATTTSLKTLTFNVWGNEAVLSSIPAYKTSSPQGTLFDVNGVVEITVDFYVDGYTGNLAFTSSSGIIDVEIIELVQKPLGAPKRILTSKRPNLKAKTGLAFNGKIDYFYTTDITADEIEFELSTDNLTKIQALSHPNVSESGNAANLNGYIDAQGKPYFFTTNTDGTRTDLRTTLPLSLGVRTKIKFSVKDGRKLFINNAIVASDNKQVTNNVFRFGKFSEATDLRFQGTLFKVTCYLNNQVVAQYDFENPSNLIGDKVIPNAKNLIPSFEDSRWSLHQNFKVLGKDVGRLEATDNWQSSIYTIPNLPVGNKYTACLSEGRVSIDSYDQNNMKTVLASRQFSPFTFTVPNGSVRIEFLCTNFGTGSYTFAKPQLYELSGKEGTLVGKPIVLLKVAKRLLYNKR